jgi:hypothetical protein
VFYDGIEDRGNAEQSQACLQMRMDQTNACVVVIHAGAHSHLQHLDPGLVGGL